MFSLTFAKSSLALGVYTFYEEILTPNIYFINPLILSIFLLSYSITLYKVNREI
jgi:hypothetical protein